MISDETVAKMRAQHVAESQRGSCDVCGHSDPCLIRRLLDALAEARQMAQAWEHAACARQTERDEARAELEKMATLFSEEIYKTRAELAMMTRERDKYKDEEP